MSHQDPPQNLECLVCCMDIDQTNYCEYQTHENSEFISSPICYECLNYMINNDWNKFQKLLEQADCRAAYLRLCNKVPLYLSEKSCMPCKQHGDDCPTNQEINKLFIFSTKQEIIPLLVGAKQGLEREQYINDLKEMAEHYEQEKKNESSN